MTSQEKVLSEKLKYLFTIESNQQFEIFDLDVDFMGGDDYYTIFLTFDYHGPIDGLMYNFSSNIEEMLAKLGNLANNITITPDKKIVLSSEGVSVSEPFINKVNFELEQTHVFSVSIDVMYKQDS